MKFTDHLLHVSTTVYILSVVSLILVFTDIHPARCARPATWVSPALFYSEEYELSEAKWFAQLVNGDRI